MKDVTPPSVCRGIRGIQQGSRSLSAAVHRSRAGVMTRDDACIGVREEKGTVQHHTWGTFTATLRGTTHAWKKRLEGNV